VLLPYPTPLETDPRFRQTYARSIGETLPTPADSVQWFRGQGTSSGYINDQGAATSNPNQGAAASVADQGAAAAEGDQGAATAISNQGAAYSVSDQDD
jgi:hypothetical protein